MNKILLAVILAGFGAQLIKMILSVIKHKRLSWKDLLVTGGMPSSHSAFVVALVVIIGLEEGLSSTFVVSLVLAMIVLRDAFGVRRAVGNEGKELKKLLLLHKIRSRFHFALGHSPKEVLVGSLIGVVIAVLVHFLV